MNNRIKIVRDSKDMTRKQFGKVIGVSSRTVESWEQGIRGPSKSAQKLIDQVEISGGYKVTAEIVNVIPEHILREYQDVYATPEEAAISITKEELANKLLKTHTNIFTNVMVDKV